MDTCNSLRRFSCNYVTGLDLAKTRAYGAGHDPRQLINLPRTFSPINNTILLIPFSFVEDKANVKSILQQMSAMLLVLPDYPLWGRRSGGAMVLGKLSVLGRRTNLDYCRARAFQ